ncbi:hypothetical protein [Tenacibaculum agarivorans]|uniref:hypothetical protein n=1 Tax=Tenacibaculum agarivorans TaxID=1908389 RepID=UPI00094BC0BB|nr:hypothetical protein [Tenacibaculum agarivorans]
MSWLSPTWSALSHTSILHAVNIFLITLQLDFNIQNIEETILNTSVIALAIVLIGVHYVLIVKKKSFPERLQSIKESTFKQYDFIHLIYELSTIAFYCSAYKIAWINFFYICAGLIVLFVFRHFSFSK